MIYNSLLMLLHHIKLLLAAACLGYKKETITQWGLSPRFELVFALRLSSWTFEKYVCSIKFSIICYTLQLLQLFQAYLEVLQCDSLFQLSCYSRGCRYCSCRGCAHFLFMAHHAWPLPCPILGSLFFRFVVLLSQYYWYMRNYLTETDIMQLTHSMP